MSFINSQISGTLRQIGKKSSKGPEKLGGYLALVLQRQYMLIKWRNVNFLLRVTKGPTQTMVEEKKKLSNQAGKSEDAKTRRHKMLSFLPSILTCRNHGKKREGKKRIQTANIFRGKV